MKKTFFCFPIAWLFFFQSAQAIDYYGIGDTLFVWAQSGLTLRVTPSQQAEKLALLPYGTAVIVQEDSYSDRQEMSVTEIKPLKSGDKNFPGYTIKGHWVKVSVHGKEGFVFDGYLSTLPPVRPVGGKQKFPEEPVEYCRRVFGVLSEHMQGNVEVGQTGIVFRNGIIYSENNSEGGGEYRLVLPGLSMAEAYLFANTFFHLAESTNTVPREQEQVPHELRESSRYVLFFHSPEEMGAVSYVEIICVEGLAIIVFGGGC